MVGNLCSGVTWSIIPATRRYCADMGEGLIVEPVSLGNAIKIKALSIEPRNPGCTVSPIRFKLLFVEDLHDIKFQPILQDIIDDAVVPLGADNQANLQNNRLRITNNREMI